MLEEITGKKEIESRNKHKDKMASKKRGESPKIPSKYDSFGSLILTNKGKKMYIKMKFIGLSK